MHFFCLYVGAPSNLRVFSQVVLKYFQNWKMYHIICKVIKWNSIFMFESRYHMSSIGVVLTTQKRFKRVARLKASVYRQCRFLCIRGTDLKKSYMFTRNHRPPVISCIVHLIHYPEKMKMCMLFILLTGHSLSHRRPKCISIYRLVPDYGNYGF